MPMKNLNTFKVLIITWLISCSFISKAQDALPSVKLRTSQGRTIDFAELGTMSKDTPVVISFWATWCIPCITELDIISETLELRQQERPFHFFGVSIDDTRTSRRVKPFIKGKGWHFEVLMDINSELKRSLNVTDVPHVLILKDNKVVYRHTGYIAGEENNLFAEIKKL